MAKKTILDPLSTKPNYMTTLGTPLPDGRCRSSMDNSVWAYGSIPLRPVHDAATSDEQMKAIDPVYNGLKEIEGLISVASKRRFVARSAYRYVHLLLVNVPEYFRPPWNDPLATYLTQGYGNHIVDRRLTLMGVRLKDQIGGGGGMRDMISSASAFIADQQVPLADFDADFKRVKNAYARAGVVPPTDRELNLADGYWSGGTTNVTPRLTHAEHMHLFHRPEAMRQAEIVGVHNCEDLEDIPDQSALTYASVVELDFEFDEPDSPRAEWVTQLLDNGAIAVSIKGWLEPAAVTSKELRRQRRRFLSDINDRVKQNKMSDAEQTELLERLESTEGYYKAGKPNPTLIDASIVAAFTGVADLDAFNTSGHTATLAPMSYQQPGAMAETWLCSNIRANPRRHDLPIHVIAASGINNLSFVGDDHGALLGFTERDDQPVRISPASASTTNGLPILAGFGSTGSGKTQVMLHLINQWARRGENGEPATPGVMVDPKFQSDHSAVFEDFGGEVIRLDEVMAADGIFDAMRFLDGPAGVGVALSNILHMNPFGGNPDAMEQDLRKALTYGQKQGAKCTGRALQIAKEDIGDSLPAGMVQRVLDLADSPEAAAQIGMDDNGRVLTVSNGATLVMVGDSRLDLPKEGAVASRQGQRIAISLVRMMVWGSAAALARHDGGWVMLDEAWTFLQDPKEVIDLGRTARSMKVLLGLFTQLPSDVTRHGLESFISRYLVGPLVDAPAEEVMAACKAAGVDPDRWVDRLTADQFLPGSSNRPRTLNTQSMKALIDPDTGKVLRGAVWLHKDLIGGTIPTEVRLTPDFLRRASTNPDDIKRRRQVASANA